MSVSDLPELISSPGTPSSSSSDLRPPKPPNLNFTDVSSADDDEAIKNFTDDELKSFIAALRNKAKEQDHRLHPSSTRVIRISQGYVTKLYGNDWIQDLKAGVDIARGLGIRAPAIERILKNTDGRGAPFECVQEYVPGTNLVELFPKLDLQETIRLAFQLRGMLKIMHKKTNDQLGSCHSLKCRSYWLEYEAGLPPASTAEDIAKVVNFWSNYTPKCAEAKKSFEELKRCCTTGPAALDCPLVFTHHDLAPRNMIVDPRGDLWLIDWDYAGWYPAYFDRASMDHFSPYMCGWSIYTQFRWTIFCSIATESKWERQVDAVHSIKTGSGRYGDNCRSFTIKAGLTPVKLLPNGEYPDLRH
ncbi:hypothetical protein TWF106_006534 [Orbilia oligospora]|uniref:Aminoglycoside phosphotransferase domain-containing protein n=1 Tax=Orbilia oligospora TaxID=2813651 RepID=A0A6G1M1D6_ORBOL|nr:hypothetical protein TWF788_009972 [Orbilia oligospora]KAF3211813.1 hypothetical protein TWF679_006303 [Orbilia oligospora]KAF3220937.1 hypothetical protein TWF106_006534 [Orbilia oligospora]KAF3240086.1 hypothetical protein TWF192_009622 [Orbilia oligospora]